MREGQAAMCLATPARILSRERDEGWVSLGETELRVQLCMTPEAGVGDWVLVHAGFAIQQLDESEARAIWAVMEQFEDADAGGEPAP